MVVPHDILLNAYVMFIFCVRHVYDSAVSSGGGVLLNDY